MGPGKLRVLPFPRGKDFTVSFVDDTDLSTRENTEPVYEFLKSMNVRGTKTVWTTKQQRTSAFRREDEKPFTSNSSNGLTLEDPVYLAFVLDLKKGGFEIALHGVAAGNSYRDEIIEGINRFKEIFGEYPKINVFHERNIENLYAGKYKLDLWPLKLLERITDNSDYQGHIEGTRHFWGDIARERIKYARLPFHTILDVNTLKVNPSMPFHDDRRPYVNYWFSSSDGSDYQRFIKLLCEENISKLRAEKGACLIYTHFAKGFTDKNNGYRLKDGFVKAMENLRSYTDVWLPTASELLDRLLACQSIEIKQRDFDLIIRNESETDIEDLTLQGGSDILLKDKTGTEYPASKDGRIIIGSLRAGSKRVFKSNQAGKFTLVAKRRASIPRRERIKIELYNYYGLLAQRRWNSQAG